MSGLFSEGSKRGLSVNRMAELVCKNPAERYGLLNKGDIAVGYDADLVLLDDKQSFVVRAAESESSQGYTPFEGMELNGKVTSTFLRGNLVYDNGTMWSDRRAANTCHDLQRQGRTHERGADSSVNGRRHRVLAHDSWGRITICRSWPWVRPATGAWHAPCE